MTLIPFSSIDLQHDFVLMTHELLAAGYDDRAITRMVGRGDLHRLRHGAYTFGSHWRGLDPVERRKLVAHATLRSARSPAALAGPSAADVLGVPVWGMGDEVHLARLDRKAGRRTGSKVQHRGAMLVEDITVRGGIPITSGTRTALDMIALADVPRALVTVNGLLHARETTPELLERRAASMRYDPHTLESTIVLRLADGRCESAGESLSLHLVWRQHLPKPDLQVLIRNRSGRVVARVDFVWPAHGVFMEFDGKEKYHRYRRPGETIEQAVLREKRREELICGLTGWRCIRIVWADLHHPERTAARILATLHGEPWAA
ncbi:type IV toxin-antitoxin system AbiEi family antitoxin domain-containing protein [Nocardioides conyzicola]|uniref:AbiEi antitoxin N-terminal domain-containing protein n=1 Tax=Nocardioides conyzicola TaxID=1651781 RepID=A0ABP8X1V8_9ACTN